MPASRVAEALGLSHGEGGSKGQSTIRRPIGAGTVKDYLPHLYIGTLLVDHDSCAL